MGLWVLSSPALAADPMSLPAVNLATNPDGTQTYSITLQVLVLMTALTLLPAILMMMTAFTRIIIVFSILRQAIGLQSTPSNQILIGLAIFLTIFVMSPVLKEINEKALQPYMKEELQPLAAVEVASVPLRKFMLAQTREADLDLFVELAGKDRKFASLDEVPLTIVIPAFVTSELKTAFQIGFLLFIPFLIIDLVVASVLMAMGMMMLSPMIVSMPFKIMLFVFVDGWAMVVGTVASSFGL
ncbi:MAG: flagellar type III secretion system pore protein FliP [Gammaproteobacteria bacterium]|nr:flagellar type III secretion system pore protein FliP [Gammaproteobacteria bacterium]